MMMKRLYVFLLVVFILFAIGCEDKVVTTEPKVEIEPVVEQVKATIPLDERRFIYNNGIKVEHKNFSTVDEKKINITSDYPVISGLKDKSIQDKINQDIQDVGKKLVSQYESIFLALRQDDIIRVNGKSSSSYIPYSYNNVIFVESNAYIDVAFKDNNHYPSYTSVSYGYDLNTGEKIGLSDIFKPGSDYKAKINNFISQYIIENNYDDYETERMTKPFQGIKEDQSYSLSFEGLRIILDEKNDEFFNNGYLNIIVIPFKYLEDDLYVFDKYFDESKNIFEQDKLSKKLLPNKLEFKVNSIINEQKPKYYIYAIQGEFVNVPNKEIEEKLNEMVVLSIDLEDFKNKAANINDTQEISQYGHNVNIFTNVGGYLSMSVFEDIRFGRSQDSKREPFNYDFNQNKELLLRELFVDKVDISNVIKSYIKRNMNFSLSDEILELGIMDAVKTNKFYFDEYGVAVYVSTEGLSWDEYQKWVYVPFEEFGIENVAIFN
jgi:hypothetical protein